MKRFFNNESDDFFENTEDEEEVTAYIDEEELMELLEEHVNNINLNQDLLKMAISIAETKPLWGWRTEKWQIATIERIFNKLKIMRDIINKEE